jgi:hypothetical protein
MLRIVTSVNIIVKPNNTQYGKVTFSSGEIVSVSFRNVNYATKVYTSQLFPENKTTVFYQFNNTSNANITVSIVAIINTDNNVDQTIDSIISEESSALLD